MSAIERPIRTFTVTTAIEAAGRVCEMARIVDLSDMCTVESGDAQLTLPYGLAFTDFSVL